MTEDGAPQEIRVSEYEKLDEAPPVSGDFGQVRVYEKLKQTQIAPEETGDNKYKNRRLLALYFDMTSMQPADQLRALAASAKYIQTQMTAADLMAILRYSVGAVEVCRTSPRTGAGC